MGDVMPLISAELEQDTLFDRAAIGYAQRLNKPSGCIPTLESSQNVKSSGQHVLCLIKACSFSNSTLEKLQASKLTQLM